MGTAQAVNAHCHFGKLNIYHIYGVHPSGVRDNYNVTVFATYMKNRPVDQPYTDNYLYIHIVHVQNEEN